jgi:hypothetical protein
MCGFGVKGNNWRLKFLAAGHRDDALQTELVSFEFRAGSLCSLSFLSFFRKFLEEQWRKVVGAQEDEVFSYWVQNSDRFFPPLVILGEAFWCLEGIWCFSERPNTKFRKIWCCFVHGTRSWLTEPLEDFSQWSTP